MKLHTSLNRTQIIDAGRYAGVYFTRLVESGSRTHARKFDVILSGASPRKQNNNRNGDADYAATWDQWGDFLGYLYRQDPAMLTTYYWSADHFNWATGYRFDGTLYVPHTLHKFEWGGAAAPTKRQCQCGATMQYASKADWLAEHPAQRIQPAQPAQPAQSKVSA